MVPPKRYTKFVAAFYAQEDAIKADAAAEGSGKPAPNYWILKPVGLSRGRGISLISDIGAVKYDSQVQSSSGEKES